jgi:hypothetical protein
MKTTILTISLLSLSIVGCMPAQNGGTPGSTPENEVPVEPIKLPKHDYMVAIAVDTTGSFMDEMFGSSGRAYQFTQAVIQRLASDRPGCDDHIMLAQLSAKKRSPLWQGSPRDLRRRFKSSDNLKDFILKQSNPGSSPLYAGINQVLKYLLTQPGVSEGETPVCVLVLSDMDDNSPTQSEDREELIETLKRFKNVKGKIGFYFVDADNLEKTRECLTDAGMDPRHIQSRIVDQPTLPSFAN